MTIEARDLETKARGGRLYPWLLRYFQDEDDAPEIEEITEKGDPSVQHVRQKDNLSTFIRYMQSNKLAEDALMFQTHYSVGFTTTNHNPGDCVFAVDGIPEPLLLRSLGNNNYRVLGRCYLWAALELDYWNPGSRLGLWPDRPYDLGPEQTRMITLC